MDEHSTKVDGRTAADGTGLFTGAAWFDPIEPASATGSAGSWVSFWSRS